MATDKKSYLDVMGLPFGRAVNGIVDPIERAIALDANAANMFNKFGLVDSAAPQASKIGNAKSYVWQQLENFGILNPSDYKVKAWFYPIQTYALIFQRLYRNSPNIPADERGAISFANWKGLFPSPIESNEQNIYLYKLNVLRQFLNGAGFSKAIREMEGEESRTGQAAQAAQQASAAAAAYKAAMERQAREQTEIESQQAEILTENQVKNNIESTADFKTSIPSWLPFAALGLLALVVLRRG